MTVHGQALTDHQDVSVLEWARTATFEQPLRWGPVEAGILAREPLKAENTPAWVHLVGVFGYLWTAFMIAATFGAPLLGLALLAMGDSQPGLADGWFVAARIAFLLGCLSGIFTVRLWWSMGRRRGSVGIAGGVVAVAAAAVSYWILIGTDQQHDVTGLGALILATGALGLLILGLMAFSRPEGRGKSRKPPLRGPRNTAMWARYRDTRTAVLDILVARRLVKVDESDRKRLLEMPMGYWDELDGVEETEWRRILELRAVGWRDFDASDRRPWPPQDSSSS